MLQTTTQAKASKASSANKDFSIILSSSPGGLILKVSLRYSSQLNIIWLTTIWRLTALTRSRSCPERTCIHTHSRSSEGGPGGFFRCRRLVWSQPHFYPWSPSSTRPRCSCLTGSYERHRCSAGETIVETRKRKVSPGWRKVTDDLGFLMHLLKSRENVNLSAGAMFFYFCMSLRTQSSKSSGFRLKKKKSLNPLVKVLGIIYRRLMIDRSEDVQRTTPMQTKGATIRGCVQTLAISLQICVK